MHFRTHNRAWWGAGLLLVALLAVPLFGAASGVGAAPPAPRTLPALVPNSVRSGAAALVGAHAPADSLYLVFLLPLRDQAGLDAFLTDVANPSSPNYGHYLSEAQVTERFGPDTAHVANVQAWLRANGLSGGQAPADRLYVQVTMSAASAGKLLGVQINDYTLAGRTFYAPDRAPTLPAAISADVQTILGLDNARIYHTDNQKQPVSAAPNGGPPFVPADFQDAYDTTPLIAANYTGQGLHVSITLWQQHTSDSSLNTWSSTSGSPVATVGNGRLVVTYPNGGPGQSGDDGEAALDIESISGMAPAAIIHYYEASQPTDSALAVALDQAGSDPNAPIISNSWGAAEDSTGINAFDSIFATHSASGHSYFFSSGDNGSWSHTQQCSGQDPWPDYPTASRYVVSVGGTHIIGSVNHTWPGERTWDYDPTGNVICNTVNVPEGSGGGYSNLTARPSWQTGPGITGSHRGYPDVAADADPNSGAYVCSDTYGCAYAFGGTSLAAPLWAGMLTITNQYLAANGHAPVGFFAPTVYTLAGTSQTYAPFHDITSGTNGHYNAGAHWDAVTGVGSPDLWNIARDLRGPVVATPTPVATPTYAPGQVFSDVPPSNPFFTPINWCYAQGLISGYADGTFRPNNNATRGQVAKIVTLAAGWTIDTSGGPHFTDVPTSNPFYGVIETAYHHGVISGYADHTFRPNTNITRAQFSKVIVLAVGWAIDTSGGPHFTDVPASNPFYGVIETAYNHGIISGYADHTFRPNTNITRGQLAKLLYLTYSLFSAAGR